jgi:hypothetical protein
MRDNMEDLNKISSTRVGDNIHFYVNGQEDKGVVVKMDTGYVTVLKDDGNFQDIHINDTFFIKDILVNKTWNDMTMEERSVKLVEIKAYSPRFVGKSWQELPPELKAVLEKGKDGALPNPKGKPQGQSHYGQSSQARGLHEELEAGEDYDDDRMGNPAWGRGTHHEQTLDTIGNPSNRVTESIGYGLDEDKKTPKGNKSPKDMEIKKSNVEDGVYGNAGNVPLAGVNTNQEEDAPDDYEGQTDEEKKEQFKHEKLKPSSKTSQEQIWEDWLNKETMSGGDSSPAQTAITTGTTGVYNAVYGKDGRIKGQEEDREEDETEKDKEKERKG